MKQTEWKIIFSNFSGIQRRSVELLNMEVGRQILRENGKYIIHVLPCENETVKTQLNENVIIIGLWHESALIRRFINSDEIPSDGNLVKVIKNPDQPEYTIVLLTARESNNLYYAAVSFLDDYAVECMTCHGGLRYPDKIFDFPFQEHVITTAPKIPVRSVFAWGHAINDYREYIRNMARLRLNRLILWNDHIPLNIHEFIEFAHSFGIEVFGGFAWGWINGCGSISNIDPTSIRKLKNSVVEKYQTEYAHIGFDGIYLQSFTERGDDTIGGRVIAAVVTDFVNETADELFTSWPDLQIEFGLHAISVRNHLDEIARVDPRIEILWEDCGEFPYNYLPSVRDEEKFIETLAFTEKIIKLRPTGATGLCFKGMATLDWCNGLFRYQRGSYIMGENAPEIMAHDKQLRDDAWRTFSAEWSVNGHYAAHLAKFAWEISQGKIHFCMAGAYDGQIRLPYALCSEIFWNPAADFNCILERVIKRPLMRGNI